MTLEQVSCELCADRPARLVCIRSRGDDIRRVYVCLECARERARLYAAGGLDFENILGSVTNVADSRCSPAYGCRSCGTTLADIVADGRAGCCACYSRFSGEIEQAVRTVQEHTRHVGKAPGA